MAKGMDSKKAAKKKPAKTADGKRAAKKTKNPKQACSVTELHA